MGRLHCPPISAHLSSGGWTTTRSNSSSDGRIQRRRESRGLTQIQLAAQCKTDQGSISRLENGRQGFDSELLHRIVEELGLDLLADAFGVQKFKDLPPEAIDAARTWPKLPEPTRRAIREILRLSKDVT